MVDENDAIVPDNGSAPIVDESGTYVHTESRWLHALLYIITALIFAFFFVLAGRWVYHRFHHHNSVVTTPATNNVPSKTANQSPAASQSPSPSPSSSSGKQATPSPSPQASPPAASPTSSIPNTGPGNMAAVFLVTASSVAGLHYIVTSRRLRQ